MPEQPEERDLAFLQRLEQLFDEVVAAPPDLRPRIIELKCAHSPELKQRLLRLLAAHDEQR